MCGITTFKIIILQLVVHLGNNINLIILKENCILINIIKIPLSQGLTNTSITKYNKYNRLLIKRDTKGPRFFQQFLIFTTYL